MTNFGERSSYFARNYERTAEFKRERQSSNKLKLLRQPANILEEERLFDTNRNLYNPRFSHFKSEMAPIEYDSNSEKKSEDVKSNDSKLINEIK